VKNIKNSIKKEKTKNKVMVAATSVAIVAGLYGTGAIANSFEKSSREEVAEMLAVKFNLREEERVVDIFGDYRVENKEEDQSEMQTRFEEKLNEAIGGGKITREQKNLILAKHIEIGNKINSEIENWSEDEEDRIAQMEIYRKEVRQWAEDNRIDISLVGFRNT